MEKEKGEKSLLTVTKYTKYKHNTFAWEFLDPQYISEGHEKILAIVPLCHDSKETVES